MSAFDHLGWVIAVAMTVIAFASWCGADMVREHEQKRTDNAELDALLAQGEADAYHAALLFSVVERAYEDIESTPIHDNLVVVQFRRDLDGWNGEA